MAHRDRAGDPPGRRGAAGDAGHRQGFPTPSDTPLAGSPARPEAASPNLVDGGFRAASRMARGAPHRHATRSLPKALGSRLYGPLLRTFGISTRFQRGFTLIELLVVLLIMGTLITLAPAAFHRIAPGLEMKAAAREVAGLLREARSQAIRDNRETAVLIDTERKVYRLGEGARGHKLGEALDVSLVTATSEQLDDVRGRIRFFPDGTSTGGRVTLSRDDRKFDITVDWLTGLVAISD